ncbi:hypothetical protein [Vibrio phage vB_VpaP_SJSY21]|nr:hypothetical protein [Vibrio phage vB_VpaP_SJSY21]
MRNLPKYLFKPPSSLLERTPYGSYVNVEDDGMAAQKNAMSYKEAYRFGYRRATRLKDD